MQSHIIQYLLVLVVRKINIIEYNFSLLPLICRGAVRLMIVLPSPYSGMLITFHELIALLAGIYERNISVIDLMFLVEKRKYASRARHRHNYKVELLAELIYRHIKALVKCKEARKPAEGKSRHARKSQSAAHNGNYDIAYISYLGVCGHKHIRVDIRLARTLVKLVIQLYKLLYRLFLVVKDLYDLLSVHHFLDVAVYGRYILLLLHKVFSGKPAELTRHEQHYAHHRKGHKRKRTAYPYHGYKHRYYRDKAVEKLRYALAYHLAERIYVVGVAAHDVAVRVGIEIAYRKTLHVLKHLVP